MIVSSNQGSHFSLLPLLGFGGFQRYSLPLFSTYECRSGVHLSWPNIPTNIYPIQKATLLREGRRPYHRPHMTTSWPSGESARPILLAHLRPPGLLLVTRQNEVYSSSFYSSTVRRMEGSCRHNAGGRRSLFSIMTVVRSQPSITMQADAGVCESRPGSLEQPCLLCRSWRELPSQDSGIGELPFACLLDNH
jgi:hypothetical protein